MVSPLLALAALLGPTIQHANAYNSSTIQVNNAAFDLVLGPTPDVIELATSDLQLFHEAGVYHPPTKALWVVSEVTQITPNSSTKFLSRITGLDSPASVTIERINTTIPNLEGGHRYIQGTSFGDVIMFVADGTAEPSPPAGVYALNPYPPYNTSLVLGSYGAYPFNSVDEITVTSDGIIWFTDPSYGYYEGYRSTALLPNQVYAYNPATNDVRVVADGFGRPNGMTFSPDGSTAYIGDTGAQIGNGTTDSQGPRTIYAFDRRGDFLVNRHVFAMPKCLDCGPDGIKMDTQGNVWAAVNELGITVWNAKGTLLGSFAIDADAGNIGFGEPGEVFLLGGKKLLKLRVSEAVVGVGVYM